MRLLRTCTLRPDRSMVGNVAGEKAAQKVAVRGYPGASRRALVATIVGFSLGTSLFLALAPGIANASPLSGHARVATQS